MIIHNIRLLYCGYRDWRARGCLEEALVDVKILLTMTLAKSIKQYHTE
jgi:hypothetical protein